MPEEEARGYGKHAGANQSLGGRESEAQAPTAGTYHEATMVASKAYHSIRFLPPLVHSYLYLAKKSTRAE